MDHEYYAHAYRYAKYKIESQFSSKHDDKEFDAEKDSFIIDHMNGSEKLFFLEDSIIKMVVHEAEIDAVLRALHIDALTETHNTKYVLGAVVSSKFMNKIKKFKSAFKCPNMELHVDRFVKNCQTCVDNTVANMEQLTQITRTIQTNVDIAVRKAQGNLVNNRAILMDSPNSSMESLKSMSDSMLPSTDSAPDDEDVVTETLMQMQI